MAAARVSRIDENRVRAYRLAGDQPGTSGARDNRDEGRPAPTAQFTPDDLAAVILYLRSLPPLPDPS